SAGASLTALGKVMGTPRYMSPEQAEGLDTVDSRTDIYSLGVMLYEALAGRPPFAAGSVVELLLKIVKEPVRPPSADRPPGSVDPRLERICLKALAKDPSARHATAEGLAADLEEWLAGPAPAPPAPARIPPPAPGPEAPRRRSRGRPLLAGTLLLLGAGAGVFFARTSAQERQSWMARARDLIDRREADPSSAPGPVPPRDMHDAVPRKPKEDAAFRGASELVARHPGPVDAAFIDAVGRLAPGDQVLSVVEKLRELNPKFAGVAKHRVEQGRVVEWVSVTSALTDLSPLRALPGLKAVEIPAEWDAATGRFLRSRLSDLAPLKGMALQRLRIPGTAVHDLSPLRGMPLATLRCDWTEVADLGPLAGAPLASLDIAGTPVSSLAPLAGAPLEFLNCAGTKVTDLSPLRNL